MSKNPIAVLPLLALVPVCFAQNGGLPPQGRIEEIEEIEALGRDFPPPPAIARPAGAEVFGFQERRYELQPGDVFEVTFPFVPEFNQKVTIQPDGFVTLNPIGDLKAAGNTVPKLGDYLTERYQTVLKDPDLRINLLEFRQPYFTAGGEVGRPGKYELSDHTTVAEAVAIAGGFTAAAKHSQVLLFRSYSEEWVEVKKLNIKELIKRGDLSEDLQLRSGDMIYVPKSALSKVSSFIPRFSLMPRIRVP